MSQSVAWEHLELQKKYLLESLEKNSTSDYVKRKFEKHHDKTEVTNSDLSRNYDELLFIDESNLKKRKSIQKHERVSSSGKLGNNCSRTQKRRAKLQTTYENLIADEAHDFTEENERIIKTKQKVEALTNRNCMRTLSKLETSKVPKHRKILEKRRRKRDVQVVTL